MPTSLKESRISGYPRRFIYDPSLVLYLPLYLLDGNAFSSKDRYGHVATATGTTWVRKGRTFNGTSDFIDCGNPASLKLQYFEFLIWARATVGNSDLLSHAGESASGWHITLQANRILFGDSFVSDHTDWDPASFDPRDGVWRLYGFYRDTDNSTGITVNGEVVKTGSYATDFGFTGNVQIGRRSSAQGNYLTGTEGEAIGYNRKLAIGERRYVYLATKWRYTG